MKKGVSIMHTAEKISEFYKQMKKDDPELYEKEMKRRDKVFKYGMIFYGISFILIITAKFFK